MTREEWIEHYRRAWESGDADEIVNLFTPGASYRSSVFRQPYLGRDAIRAYWAAWCRASARDRVSCRGTSQSWAASSAD